MKIGIRKPSLKRSISARTTGAAKRAVKRAIIPGYGKKGMGWITNPKKAAYNAVYHRTTVGVSDLLKSGRSSKKSSRNTSASQNFVRVSPAPSRPSAKPSVQSFSSCPDKTGKWYNSAAKIIGTFLVVPPLGIAMMWKHTAWNRIVKILVSILVGLYTLFWGITAFFGFPTIDILLAVLFLPIALLPTAQTKQIPPAAITCPTASASMNTMAKSSAYTQTAEQGNTAFSADLTAWDTGISNMPSDRNSLADTNAHKPLAENSRKPFTQKQKLYYDAVLKLLQKSNRSIEHVDCAQTSSYFEICNFSPFIRLKLDGRLQYWLVRISPDKFSEFAVFGDNYTPASKSEGAAFTRVFVTSPEGLCKYESLILRCFDETGRS